jgi:mannose-6-phosphate isomerase-like protein (cupin superfamily)
MRAHLHPGAVAALLAMIVGGCTTRDAESVRRSDSTLVASPIDPATDAPIPASASARGAKGVEYYEAALLRHIGDSLAATPRTGHSIGAHPTFQYLQIRRGSSGVPEVHDAWIDVTMVQSGRATLRSGGRVVGSRLQSPGEHRGGTIEGGSTRPVGAGDLMVIPAGIPHQYEIGRGDSLRYLTVKVQSPAAPR